MSEVSTNDVRRELDNLRRQLEIVAIEARAIELRREEIVDKIKSFEAVVEHMVSLDERSEIDALPAKLMRSEMVAILKDAGRPMRTSELHDVLKAKGIPINGQDTMKNVGSHLSLDDRFERYGTGLWGLSAWKGRPPALNKDVEESVGARSRANLAHTIATSRSQPSSSVAAGERDPDFRNRSISFE